MPWWDVYVQAPDGSGEVVGAYLQHLGSTGVVTYDDAVLSPGKEIMTYGAGSTVLYGALPVDATLPVRVCALQQFLAECIETTSARHWKLYCRPLRDLDYLTQWHRFFHPFSIAQRLMIHPPWETVTVTPPMDRLVLEPGLAFGTGLHPTTRMCLTLLAQCVTPHRKACVLDVGCGSGILSLAALKFGAAAAVGVDTDARAVQEAIRNATLNGQQAQTRFLQGSLHAMSEQFAWITANIYLDPLVEMMPTLASCLAPQGYVILSGILTSQETTLREAMQTAALSVQRRLAEGRWVALQGRHASEISS